MNPHHFLRMYLAETRKTFTRGSAVAALGVAAAVAIVSLVAMKFAANAGSDATMNGQPLAKLFEASGGTVTGWALKARNFYVLPLLLLWATGSSFAGEIRDHTLREVAVRAVPRTAILAAKLVALLTLSAGTLVVTGLLTAVLGASFFGAEGTWLDLLGGYAASWLSDLGLLSLGTLAALYLRSEAGVVVGVTLALMADLGLRLVLKLAGVLGVTSAASITPWLPGSALGAWEGYSSGWAWEPFASVTALIVIVLGLAVWRFQRLDIP
jgi:ABC-type transport system involved in multi-copper enzyme maturation permease subunit